MKIRTVRHLWGVEEAWETFVPKAKSLGYFALETCLHIFSEKDQQRLRDLCKQNDLKFVNQSHTDSYEPGVRVKDVKTHLETLRSQTENAMKVFGSDLIFCNSHSGYDGWNPQQMEEFFAGAIEIEKSLGVPIYHETHRKRCLYNPWTTRDILIKFPTLKITADLSHWFCVLSETTMKGEWDIIQLISSRTGHLHGRVGYDNGPQVPDPRAPEYQALVEAHEECWDLIWKTQSEMGEQFTYFEPEYGPPSYMHTHPYTQMPVVNLFDICEWQREREVERFNKMFGTIKRIISSCIAMRSLLWLLKERKK